MTFTMAGRSCAGTRCDRASKRGASAPTFKGPLRSVPHTGKRHGYQGIRPPPACHGPRHRRYELRNAAIKSLGHA